MLLFIECCYVAGIVVSTLYALEAHDGKLPITLAKELFKYLQVTLNPGGTSWDLTNGGIIHLEE